MISSKLASGLQGPFQALDAVDTCAGHSLVDAAQQTGQYLAGAAFENGCCATPDQGVDRADPAHG